MNAIGHSAEQGAVAFTNISEPADDTSAAVSAVASETEHSRHAGWDEIVDELLRVRNFTDDWDGEGAIAPENETVDFAIQLATWLRNEGKRPPTIVCASVNGTVVFEWHSPIAYCELEIIAPYKGTWYQHEAGAKEGALTSIQSP